eukprot:1137379-Rhodomonas_salina.3
MRPGTAISCVSTAHFVRAGRAISHIGTVHRIAVQENPPSSRYVSTRHRVGVAQADRKCMRRQIGVGIGMLRQIGVGRWGHRPSALSRLPRIQRCVMRLVAPYARSVPHTA